MASLAITLLISLLLTLGIGFCWYISRKPGTNAKCVMSLGIMLAAWLCQALFVMMAILLPVPEVIFLLANLFALALTLAAAVLAIVGLQEYSRRKDRFTRGRVQAFSALGLSVLLWALTIALVVEARWNTFGTRSNTPGARVITFAEHNFKFFAPGGAWTPTSTNNINAPATLNLHRKRPPIYFAITASQEPRLDYTAAELANLATQRVQQVFHSSLITHHASIDVNWWDGLHFLGEAEQAGLDLSFDHRLFFTNGWAYHFTTWGPRSERMTIMREAKERRLDFEVMDFTRRSSVSSNAPVNN